MNLIEDVTLVNNKGSHSQKTPLIKLSRVAKRRGKRKWGNMICRGGEVWREEVKMKNKSNVLVVLHDLIGVGLRGYVSKFFVIHVIIFNWGLWKVIWGLCLKLPAYQTQMRPGPNFSKRSMFLKNSIESWLAIVVAGSSWGHIFIDQYVFGLALSVENSETRLDHYNIIVVLKRIYNILILF